MTTPRPIRRLLIANRAEIAARIARTAHRLGIVAVGVYSDADRNGAHLAEMDLAVALGGSTAAESYLRIDAIVAAAVATGCDAVHPGYGFLAENSEAARAVEAAGLMWVGPTPDQIDLLGDKIAAKRTAIEAGVPTTDIHEVNPDIAPPSDIPMPALVKAAAGGGGRGMRIVRDQSELAEAIAAAAREAHAAFGDPTVFIEPYIERGRHIEVQIIGDGRGGVLHLGERDCSVQRRNQKVIEESPAPGLSDAVRSALHDGAVALASHVSYRGAGTVEFLVGADDTITFLEVNTRLQVEHPVTEAVTGLDLVELQLAVAEGRPLPIAQHEISLTGHAIELRIVAEDPATGWLPSTGTIDAFDFPTTVRVDAGVAVGSTVTTEYDSLLAKVIARGADRSQALALLIDAMRRCEIAGVRTNADTLTAICTEPEFAAGGVDTAYLDRHPEVMAGERPEGVVLTAHLIAVAVMRAHQNRSADRHWGFARSGWRNLQTRGQRVLLNETAGPEAVAHQVEYEQLADGRWSFLVGPWPEPGADGSLPADERTALLVAEGDGAIEVDGTRMALAVTSHGLGRWRVSSPFGRTEWVEPPRFVDHDAEMVGAGPIAPLPGTVIDVRVADGDTVEADQVLMVIEAMKMEHQITAPAPAVVSSVRFAVGDRVDMGDLLVELDQGES